jgi:hypothetical protein
MVRARFTSKDHTSVASIQFGIDNRTPISDDSMTLNRTVTSNGVIPDSQPRNGITIRNCDVHRFQQGAPMSSVNPNASAQLRDFSNTVEVAGYRVSPEVAATLQNQAPEIFEPANTPAPVEAPQAPAEEYHYPIENPIGAEVVRELAQANPSHQMSVLSAMLKGNAKAFEVATQRWSEATGESVDMLRGKAQIAADAMSGQVRRLCEARGVSFEDFSRYVATTAMDTSAGVLRNQLTTGSVKGWLPLIGRFVSAKGAR